MPEFLVTWQIDIEADNAKEAAEKALEIMKDPESIATVFEIENKKKKTLHIIDLTYGDEDGKFVGDR